MQRRRPPPEESRIGDQPSTSIPLEVLRSHDHAFNHMDQSPREETVTSLPSHGLGATGETRQLFLVPVGPNEGIPMDTHAALIVNELTRDRVLMDNNPISEQRRLEMLREMAESLTLKRTVRKNLVKTVSGKSTHSPISFFKRLKYSLSMSATKFKMGVKNMLYSLELWYSSVKLIEGHYGSGVATYFKFFRQLFILNFIVFIISLSFVVIPQILYRFTRTVSNGTETESVDTFSTLQEEENSTSLLSGTTLRLPKEDFQFQVVNVPSPYSSNSDFSFGNIFTGEGFFTNTSLYYGFYTNESLEVISGLHYSIPMAYFFTSLCCYLFIFLSLSFSMAKSYRKSFIEASGGVKNIYSHKVFCGWDFSIATREAAFLKSKSIYNEIRELLNEDSKVVEERSCLMDFYIIVVKLSVHFLSLIICVGTGTVMWFMLNANLGPDSESDHRISMMMSLIVTIIIMISPILFSWLVRFEEYENPRTALNITLFRTFVLEVVIIGVLITFWLQRSHSNSTCWETSLGQEVYRLVLMDFFIAIVGTALSEFVRKRIYKTLWKSIGVPEFDIARNTLNLIYNQTLFFVGFFFSPLLSFVIVIKMFITFYIKKIGVLRNCQPSIRSWRAAQTQTLFLVLSFLSLLGVIITYGYILTQVEASDCGPFRGYPNMYQMILEGVFKLKEDQKFFKVIMFITKPGVVAGILIAMCVGVYYLRARAQAHVRMVNILQEMLILEARDKEFLLNNISKVTEETWVYGSRTARHSRLPRNIATLRRRTELRFEEGDQIFGNESTPSRSSTDGPPSRGDNTVARSSSSRSHIGETARDYLKDSSNTSERLQSSEDSATGILSSKSSHSNLGVTARNYYRRPVDESVSSRSSVSVVPSSSSEEHLRTINMSGSRETITNKQTDPGRIRKLRRF